MAIAEQKIPGGKLLRIKAEARDGKIVSVNITGDFFLYPEEKIALLENYLTGLPVPFDKEEMTEKVQHLIEKENIELVGITAEAIIAVLQETVQ